MIKTFNVFYYVENKEKCISIDSTTKHDAISQAREILGYGVSFCVKRSLVL